MKSIWTGLGMAIAAASIAAGSVVISSPTTPPPPAGTAHMWIDTTGGSCVDNAVPVAYANNGTECSSFDQAYDAAECGDVIRVMGGTYPAQNITGTRSCSGATWTVASSKGVTMSGGVLIEVADSQTVNTGDIDFQADWLEFSRGTGTLLKLGPDNGLNEVSSGNPADHVIIRGVTMNGIFFNGAARNGMQVDSVAIVDSTIGPWNNSGGQASEPVYMQTCGGGCTFVGTNVVFDGVKWKDITVPSSPDPHTEALRIDGGYDGVIVRNSEMWDNINLTTGSLFITTLGISSPSRNITITNNYFGSNGPAFFTIVPGGPTCVGLRATYNTFLEEPWQPGCTHSGTILAGNLGPRADATCYSGITYLRNVWQHTSNTACGSDTWVSGPVGGTSNLGLGGTNGFDLQNGSVAEEAGETTNCPALDHSGETRPQPVATACDAGGDERP